MWSPAAIVCFSYFLMLFKITNKSKLTKQYILKCSQAFRQTYKNMVSRSCLCV